MLQRTPDNVLFSLAPRFVDAFLSGEKKVEIRRRVPALPQGTLIWLYGKVPYGKVMAVARLQYIEVRKPTDLWREFGGFLAIPRGEFDQYLEGVEEAAGLVLGDVSSIGDPITLQTLRNIDPKFHPPQFFRRIKSGPLLDKLGESQASHRRISE